MGWRELASFWIVLGLTIDSLALICIVVWTLGFCDRPGYPFGPVFYVIGFFDLLLVDKKPVAVCLLVLAACLAFWLVVVWSNYLLVASIASIRRLLAARRKVFYRDISTQSLQETIGLAMSYLAGTSELACPKGGCVYLWSKKFHSALIQRSPSGEHTIQCGEADWGEIREGRFAAWMKQRGFPIIKWKVDRRRQLHVPQEEGDRIPQFMDIVFREYYALGDDCPLRAEVLVYK